MVEMPWQRLHVNGESAVTFLSVSSCYCFLALCSFHYIFFFAFLLGVVSLVTFTVSSSSVSLFLSYIYITPRKAVLADPSGALTTYRGRCSLVEMPLSIRTWRPSTPCEEVASADRRHQIWMSTVPTKTRWTCQAIMAITHADTANDAQVLVKALRRAYSPWWHTVSSLLKWRVFCERKGFVGGRGRRQ